MHNHIIYKEVSRKISHAMCNYLPRGEVKAQVVYMINDIALRQHLALPDWEVQTLTRQLLHDLPNRDRAHSYA